jgi:hypothetical protein
VGGTSGLAGEGTGAGGEAANTGTSGASSSTAGASFTGEGGASGAAAAGGSAGARGGTAGEDGEGGQGGAAPACNITESPADESCLVSDAFAIFVFANEGSTEGSGTMGSPFGSLALAIEKAREDGKIVIACQDHFDRPLEISGADMGFALRIYGGFDCSGEDKVWVHSGNPTVVAPMAAGPALRVQGAAGLQIEDFEFSSVDATQRGESSIAAVVASSTDVVFRRVSFNAGEGVNGAPGAPAPPLFPRAPNGHPGDGTTGGPAQQSCTCAESVGGKGGNLGTTSMVNGGDGEPVQSDGSGKGGQGGDTSCSSGTPGAPGATAPAGKGATVPGTIESLTWVPSAGDAGQSGGTAQGGGGGGGGPTGGGGGGGCGGCGGEGGTAGQGGGASIGLLMSQSRVTFYESTVTTSKAGNGGAGGPGQPGQLAGAGGDALGCPGGPGGAGGDGAPGGGGAGGISVGVVYQGDRPNNLEELFDEVLGPAGLGGSGTGTGAGIPGESAKSLQVL